MCHSLCNKREIGSERFEDCLKPFEVLNFKLPGVLNTVFGLEGTLENPSLSVLCCHIEVLHPPQSCPWDIFLS